MTPPPAFRLIMASAGSGKTYRLVQQFVAALHDGLTAGREDAAERILAATFTRKAAGEIAERVLLRLAEATRDTDGRAAGRLAVELGLPGLTAERCGQLLGSVLSRLHRLRICTLDAFLVRAAQSFAPELGLVTPWTIVDDAADRDLRLGAVDRVLERSLGSEEDFRQMLDLLRLLAGGRVPLLVRETLLAHFDATHGFLVDADEAAWETVRGDAAALMGDDEVRRTADGLVEQLRPALPRTAAGSVDKRWLSAVERLAAEVAAGAWEAALDGGLLRPLSTGLEAYYNRPMPPELLDVLRPLLAQSRNQVLTKLYGRNLATRVLLGRFDDAYRSAKAARGAYRFDDFARLLAEAEVTRGLDEFYFRLDGRVDHLLLDEFQDTSVAQWRLLEPLAAELMSGGEGAAGGGAGGRTLLCVGDVKQTLYGWRNAEPGLLPALRTRWGCRPEDLVKSYRSSPVVVDAVNRVFGTLTANPALRAPAGGDGDGAADDLAEAGRTWAGWFAPHAAEFANRTGYCRLLSCGDGPDAATRQDAALRLAAERASDLAAAEPGWTIAVLVRRKRMVAPLIHEIGRRGTAAAGEGGNPLTDDAAVCVALSALHLADHPADTAAQYHVIQSPLADAVGVRRGAAPAEVRRAAADLRRRVADAGLAAVLAGWMAAAAPAFGPRNAARFTRLVELAQDFPYDGGPLRPFLDRVRETRVEDPGAARVRVMTVHASKGREFDAVVLADLDGRLVGGSPAVLGERPTLTANYACVTTAPSAAARRADGRLGRMYSAWRQRQAVEELCGLYVGMTRAKRGLEMIVHPQAEGAKGGVRLPASPAGVLRGALAGGGPAPAGTELWRHEDSVMPAGAASPAGNGAGTATPELEVGGGDDAANVWVTELVVRVLPPSHGGRGRPVVSPSGLEGGGRVDLGRQLAFDQVDRATGASDGGGGVAARDRGTLIHRWFELVEWLDDGPPPETELRAAASDLGVADRDLTPLLAEFRAACAALVVAAVLGRGQYAVWGDGRTAAGATAAGDGPAAGVEVWRERAFAVRTAAPGIGGGEVLLQGQIDRLVVVRGGDGRVRHVDLIDYKTDRVSAADGSLARRVAYYAPQVQAYRRAAGVLTGLAPTDVRVRLLFTAAGEVVEVPPDGDCGPPG